MTTPEGTQPVQQNHLWQHPPQLPLRSLQGSFQITSHGSSIPIAKSHKLFQTYHASNNTDTDTSNPSLIAWYLPLDDLRPDVLLPSGNIFQCRIQGDCWLFNLQICDRSLCDSAWMYVENDLGTGVNGLVGLDASLFSMEIC
ncbi:DUF427 domain-containing protein [Oceanobacter antarcticus]|uniref:DUF427 domain-containing protein n=1 Tax=Oceanobacter antarcticus TaxID=3133425 RepID=A0ABW8NDY3_9GAMM